MGLIRPFYPKPKWRERVSRIALIKALNETGSTLGASVRLGISQAAVYRWIKTYGIEGRTTWH